MLKSENIWPNNSLISWRWLKSKYHHTDCPSQQCWKDPKTNTISRKWISRNAVIIFHLFFHHLSFNILYFSTSWEFAFPSFSYQKQVQKTPKKSSFIYFLEFFHPWLTKPHHCFVTWLFTWWLSNLCYFFMCRKLL